jgi:hypothetical protein
MPDAPAVQATALFRYLAAAHPGVETWPDEEFAEGGWAYFWIVSRVDGTVRTLAYVRLKAGKLQKRAYDEKGEDWWVDAD